MIFLLTTKYLAEKMNKIILIKKLTSFFDNFQFGRCWTSEEQEVLWETRLVTSS